MRPIALCLVALLITVSTGNGQVTIKAFPAQDRVTRLMNEEMKFSDLPAIVAMAIDRNGQTSSYTYISSLISDPESQQVFSRNIRRLIILKQQNYLRSIQK